MEQQTRTSRFPSSLKGIDRVERAREQNCSYFYHILIMLEFFILNWLKLPFFTNVFVWNSLCGVYQIVIGIYSIFGAWIRRDIGLASSFVVLLGDIEIYGCSILLQSVSDSMVILCLIIVGFFICCSARIPLETYELDPLFNHSILSVFVGCLSLCGVKTILLFIRWYYSFVPVSLSIIFIFLFNSYLILRVFGADTSADQTTTTTGTPAMPVGNTNIDVR